MLPGVDINWEPHYGLLSTIYPIGWGRLSTKIPPGCLQGSWVNKPNRAVHRVTRRRSILKSLTKLMKKDELDTNLEIADTEDAAVHILKRIRLLLHGLN
jgi:hypothetical protein